MAEAQQVPVSGFSVPPVPAQAQVTQHSERPAAGNMQPGFVPQGQPPAEPAGLTAAQVQEQIAAALAKAAASQAPAAPATPVKFEFASDMPADPVLSSMTELFTITGAGVDLDRAMGKAITYGDPSLIDTAYILEKGGDAGKQLATIAKAIVDRVQTQTAAASASVYDTAGGKAQWDTAASQFDKAAPKALKAVIAGLLDSGNNESIKYAAQTVVDYVKQNGLVVNPAQLIHAGATQGAAGQALSKDEFQSAHSKLNVNSRTYMAERNDLFARRQLGKQLGK